MSMTKGNYSSVNNFFDIFETCFVIYSRLLLVNWWSSRRISFRNLKGIEKKLLASEASVKGKSVSLFSRIVKDCAVIRLKSSPLLSFVVAIERGEEKRCVRSVYISSQHAARFFCLPRSFSLRKVCQGQKQQGTGP